MLQLRVAVIVVAILVIIIFGVFLVRTNTKSPAPVAAAVEEKKPDQKPTQSRSSAVIPDDMAAFPRRHVAFNPMVEVMQDVDVTFHPDVNTNQGTRARKRQAAADKSGGFQESELFARLTQGASFMTPLSSQTEFTQTSIGEAKPIPMH